MSDLHKVSLNYYPRKWQREMHKKLRRFNVLVIHRGAGKSLFAMQELIKKAMTGPDYAQYAFIQPLRNQIKRNLWEQFKRAVNPIPGIRINNQDLDIFFPNHAVVHVLGADDPDKLRGMHVHGVILDEYGDMHPKIWQSVRPMLSNHKGFVIWIGTPRGRNQFYDMYKRSQEPDRPNWLGILLPHDKTGALSADEVEQMRTEMTPDEFNQEMNVSFIASNTGAYYSKQITDLRSNGRISHTKLFRPDLEVHASFDIGMRDRTAVFWFQLLKVHDPLANVWTEDINIIDYEEQSNLGFKEWSELLQIKERTYGYRRGTLIAPWDIKELEFGLGISRLESAKQVGLRFETCPRQDIMDGIELVRRHLPRCRFHAGMCEDGIEHLAQYRARLDKAGNGLGPLHDQHSHAGDSFRYMISHIVQIMGAPQMIRMPLMRR